MKFDEIRPGLIRWTARHPEWRPGGEIDSPDDWPPDVGSVAYRARDAFLVIDPQLPADAKSFWRLMDAQVEGHGQRVVVLTTLRWHRRSRDAFAARYGASTSRARATLPQGVETIPIRRAGEVMVWLSEHGALVPGDRLLGAEGGGLRICPPSWLAYLDSGITVSELREALLPLLELPIEMVLVSHGEPVFEDGRRAVEEALAERIALGWAAG